LCSVKNLLTTVCIIWCPSLLGSRKVFLALDARIGARSGIPNLPSLPRLRRTASRRTSRSPGIKSSDAPARSFSWLRLPSRRIYRPRAHTSMGTVPLGMFFCHVMAGHRFSS
jgi:hypothetical protein